jgi:adenine phosphoribosyltransferase
MASNGHWITELIRDIPDYPQPGVTFRDITPLLGHAEGFHRSIDELVSRFEGLQVDRVLGMEARAQGCVVRAEVSLAEMFGYAGAIRSLSKGRAAYAMSPARFEPAPAALAA